MVAKSRLKSRIEELTTFVRQLAVAQQSAPQRMLARDCLICSSIEHTSDCCPLLQDNNQQASVQGIYSGGQQQYKQPKLSAASKAAVPVPISVS